MMRDSAPYNLAWSLLHTSQSDWVLSVEGRYGSFDIHMDDVRAATDSFVRMRIDRGFRLGGLPWFDKSLSLTSPDDPDDPEDYLVNGWKHLYAHELVDSIEPAPLLHTCSHVGPVPVGCYGVATQPGFVRLRKNGLHLQGDPSSQEITRNMFTLINPRTLQSPVESALITGVLQPVTAMWFAPENFTGKVCLRLAGWSNPCWVREAIPDDGDQGG